MNRGRYWSNFASRATAPASSSSALISSSQVLARPATMREKLGVVATGVFEGVSQDRQALEGAFLVDGLGQPGHDAIEGEEPLRPRHDGTEGVAEEIAQHREPLLQAGAGAA